MLNKNIFLIAENTSKIIEGCGSIGATGKICLGFINLDSIQSIAKSGNKPMSVTRPIIKNNPTYNETEIPKCNKIIVITPKNLIFFGRNGININRGEMSSM